MYKFSSAQKAVTHLTGTEPAGYFSKRPDEDACDDLMLNCAVIELNCKKIR